MTFLPPVSITISGNKCGGCCGESKIREQAPPQYLVVFTDKFRAISPGRFREEKTTPPEKVYEAFRRHVSETLCFDLEDLPPPMRFDPKRRVSVADLRATEFAVKGYLEGVKKGSNGSHTSTSTVMAPKDASRESSKTSSE